MFEAERVRIIIREISSGGKYFKKITVPKLIAPVISSVVKMSLLCMPGKTVSEKGKFSDNF